MLENYEYCATNLPAIFFDARFAKKYGIIEAIIFNDLYQTFTVCLRMIQHRNKIWNDHVGWIEEGGHWWQRYHANYLFRKYEILFNEPEHRAAIKNLCDAGLLYVRPSATDGYYWLRIGEEPAGE